MRLLPSVLLAALFIAGFAGVRPAQAHASFGMNRVNMAWVSAAERHRILENMANSGVRLVRLSLTPPVEASLDAVRTAHTLGMAVLLEIPLGYPAFYPETARKRPGFGRVWDMYRLSEIDPERVRTVVRTALRRLDRLGVSLAAVEPGNEINWAAYNGDLDVLSRPGKHVARSLSHLTDGASFKTGLSRYVAVVRVIKEELAATKHLRHTLIVSAGLAFMPMTFADRMGSEYVAPAELIAALQAQGIDRYVDAYGIHFYVNPKARSPTQRVRSALAICRAPSKGRPCWITEWGIANPSKACPLDDTRRAKIAADIRGLLERRMKAGSVAAALYFDWDTSKRYSVWRCGRLSPAGKAAVAPMPVGR